MSHIVGIVGCDYRLKSEVGGAILHTVTIFKIRISPFNKGEKDVLANSSSCGTLLRALVHLGDVDERSYPVPWGT